MMPLHRLNINLSSKTLEEEMQCRLNAEYKEFMRGTVMYEGIPIQKRPGTAIVKSGNRSGKQTARGDTDRTNKGLKNYIQKVILKKYDNSKI